MIILFRKMKTLVNGVSISKTRNCGMKLKKIQLELELNYTSLLQKLKELNLIHLCLFAQSYKKKESSKTLFQKNTTISFLESYTFMEDLIVEYSMFREWMNCWLPFIMCLPTILMRYAKTQLTVTAFSALLCWWEMQRMGSLSNLTTLIQV